MDYLETETQTQLVERLIRGSARDKYRWIGSENNEYRFVLVAGPYAFAISSRDRDDFAPFILEVYKSSGSGSGSGGAAAKKLQSIETMPGNDELIDGLEELYTMVKRKTLNLDEIATDLFAALDKLEGEE